MRFKVGARDSVLSRVQSEDALAAIGRRVKGFDAELAFYSTPGDRDLKTPIEKGAADFFTRDLDDAVLSGELDFAIHSAKDLPAKLRAGLDAFRLPEGEDARDALVWPKGREPKGGDYVGVSGERRRKWCRKFGNGLKPKTIRGSIDSRIRQMLEGRFGAVVMALAGLNRIGRVMPELIAGIETRPISLEELSPPDGQGQLAITFREDDERLIAIRSQLVKAVRIVSGGVGNAGNITMRGARDIEKADVVICDALTGFGLADGAKSIYAGKRAGRHSMAQDEICRLMIEWVKKGKRVVRLKGGDAGIYGRLAEEIAALEAEKIPYLVRPGVSALTAATAPNGILLTKRAEARGFRVGSPTATGDREPQVFFMATHEAKQILKRMPKDEHYAMVYDAGGKNERVVVGRCGRPTLPKCDDPGLLIVGYAGEVCRRERVLLTCSETIMDDAVTAVEDRGWKAIEWPMIELKPVAGALDEMESGDFVLLTSPNAVRMCVALGGLGYLWRTKIVSCGKGTDRELGKHGLRSWLRPDEASTEGLLKAIDAHISEFRGREVVRLRSDVAGTKLSRELRHRGICVRDVVIYRNHLKKHNEPLPEFDAAFFASKSGVKAFVREYGAATLKGKRILVIGRPTCEELGQPLRESAEFLPL